MSWRSISTPPPRECLGSTGTSYFMYHSTWNVFNFIHTDLIEPLLWRNSIRHCISWGIISFKKNKNEQSIQKALCLESFISHVFTLADWQLNNQFSIEVSRATANSNKIKKKSAAISDTRGPDSGSVLLKINRKCFVFPSELILWIFSSATLSPIHAVCCVCVCVLSVWERYELNKQTERRILIWFSLQ